jgi:hypothetical protein
MHMRMQRRLEISEDGVIDSDGSGGSEHRLSELSEIAQEVIALSCTQCV